jgi:hypothetical protein
MDGTNAAGRKVSLLNDHDPPHNLVRLDSFTPSLRSRTSSYSSSPIGSPPTPQLVRSNSSDSTMQTPSPATPDFSIDGDMDGNIDGTMDDNMENNMERSFSQSMDSPVYSPPAFYPQQKDMIMSHHYPQHHPMQSYPPAHNAQPGYFTQPQQHHVSEPLATPTAPSPANGRKGKNSYPCPMAKQYSCTDHFTTSGHAARHAKKHTGKKDAHCPDCGKSFTRKDNMEQHRRTHQSGRNAKGTDRDMRKVKQQARRPKTAPLQVTPPMAPLSMFDPSLPMSPAGSYTYPAPAVQSSAHYVDFHRQAYPDPGVYAVNAVNEFGVCEETNNNLNILANAASAERKFHE